MVQIADINIPDTVTVSCPLKNFQQRYLNKGCVSCSEFFKGIAPLTEANEIEVKDKVTGKLLGTRPIYWHEKFMIRCAYPMTRCCANMAIVEEE